MKKLLLCLLLPVFAWADYLFVLHDVGETVALLPVVEALRERGEVVEVVQLDLEDRYALLPREEVEGYSPDVLVVGDASAAQLQFVWAYQKQAKTVCYYDNPLEIDRIPYASLIREFEQEVDLFLVPSAVAAASSRAEVVKVVGNPDLDRFEKEVGEVAVVSGRVVYFGGYDDDYEAAFLAFLEKFPGGVVYPHPGTDGSLEKAAGALIGEGSSLQAVGEGEVVVIHRSSIGIKAALAGKTVYSVGADGKIIEVKVSRETLGLPRDSVYLICNAI